MLSFHRSLAKNEFQIFIFYTIFISVRNVNSTFLKYKITPIFLLYRIQQMNSFLLCTTWLYRVILDACTFAVNTRVTLTKPQNMFLLNVYNFLITIFHLGDNIWYGDWYFSYVRSHQDDFICENLVVIGSNRNSANF